MAAEYEATINISRRVRVSFTRPSHGYDSDGVQNYLESMSWEEVEDIVVEVLDENIEVDQIIPQCEHDSFSITRAYEAYGAAYIVTQCSNCDASGTRVFGASELEDITWEID